MSLKSASTSGNLLDELQTTLAHGTVARRVETLRRVTDLFINGAVDFSDEKIGLFDGVFRCLMEHIEISTRRCSPIVSLRLAWRCRLPSARWRSTISSKSRLRLMAISTRRLLSGAVTDVLVLRGNDEVIHSTVNNAGAEFSEHSFTRLVNRAEGDDNLASCLGMRPTIPRPLYLKLLAKASATVRERLKAANPQQAGDVPTAVQEATWRARRARHHHPGNDDRPRARQVTV
jgi:hypothetical protein